MGVFAVSRRLNVPARELCLPLKALVAGRSVSCMLPRPAPPAAADAAMGGRVLTVPSCGCWGVGGWPGGRGGACRSGCHLSSSTGSLLRPRLLPRGRVDVDAWTFLLWVNGQWEGSGGHCPPICPPSSRVVTSASVPGASPQAPSGTRTSSSVCSSRVAAAAPLFICPDLFVFRFPLPLQIPCVP